jgi:hypothetical protein
MLNKTENSDMAYCHSHGDKCHSKHKGGAILIGGLIGMGLAFLLNLFAAGIGLTAFTSTESGQMTLAIGGLLGALVGSIATMFVTGYVTGYLVGKKTYLSPNYGALYGFAAWCVALLLSAFLVGHMAQLLNAQPFAPQQNSAVVAQAGAQTMQTVAEKTNLNPEAPTAVAQRNTEMAAHNMGLSMLATFLIFFVGALSSCIGGYCGLNTHKKDKGVIADRDRKIDKI